MVVCSASERIFSRGHEYRYRPPSFCFLRRNWYRFLYSHQNINKTDLQIHFNLAIKIVILAYTRNFGLITKIISSAYFIFPCPAINVPGYDVPLISPLVDPGCTQISFYQLKFWRKSLMCADQLKPKSDTKRSRHRKVQYSQRLIVSTKLLWHCEQTN